MGGPVAKSATAPPATSCLIYKAWKGSKRSEGGLHRYNSAWRKFRTSPQKMEGKFRNNLKYGTFPAEKTPCGIPPPLYASSDSVRSSARSLCGFLRVCKQVAALRKGVASIARKE